MRGYDVLDHFMRSDAIGFRTAFMTSSRLLGLSEHLYQHEWRGYFQRRWLDRAA